MQKNGMIAAVLLVAGCLALTACDKPKDKSAEAAQSESVPAQVSDAPTLAATPVADTSASNDLVPAMMKVPADVARGKAIFAGTCGAYCHKMTNAQSDAPFLFDCIWLHGGSDEEIFHTITHGVSGTRMVAFGGAIQDDDIWRIIAYLKTASQCKK